MLYPKNASGVGGSPAAAAALPAAAGDSEERDHQCQSMAPYINASGSI